MSTHPDAVDYTALAAHLTAPDQPVRSAGEVRTGDAAAEAGRQFLLTQYGTQDAIDAAIRRGRPRVGAPAGLSPTVRGRVTDTALAQLQLLQQATGRSQSDLVREALQGLLERHADTIAAEAKKHTAA